MVFENKKKNSIRITVGDADFFKLKMPKETMNEMRNENLSENWKLVIIISSIHETFKTFHTFIRLSFQF